MSKTLKLGLPKGSLQEKTFRIFANAGFSLSISERSYLPSIDDPQIEPVLLRAQEMSRYVQAGALDCGITGADWILENDSDVIRVSELSYSKQSLKPVRWVLAVPDNSPIKSLRNLNGKRIATELVGATKRFLRKNKIKANVEFSWGATEVKVAVGLVDAIVELTETGRSLKANNLREIITVCESRTQFIANKQSYKDPFKQGKMKAIVLLLQGAIAAQTKVGLKMNLREKDLKKVVSKLPALQKPTISCLTTKGWIALETVIDESEVRRLIPELKIAGAEGIIEYSLNKVIY
ncbi:MAG: ATP phosphoribosyltransferase [Candidatus Omnitrophota bacterium]